MFANSVRGGKAFAAKQKIRELKTRVSKLNVQILKIPPTNIIFNLANNMNNVQSEKYSFSPEEIGKKSLSNERFRTMFNTHRMRRTKLYNNRLKKYYDKKCKAKRKKFRERLNISEKVLVLTERIKKKSAPGKVYSKHFIL